MMKKLSFILVLGVMGIFHSCQLSPPTSIAEGRVMVSYYRPFVSFDEIKYEYYTHLINIGLSPDVEGNIVQFDYAEAFTSACHENDVIPMYSLVNNMIEVDGETIMVYLAISRAGKMDLFISNLIKSMIDYRYEGIDVDWEMPDSDEELKVWNDMMHSIRLRMNALEEATGIHYYLTTALPEWGMNICDISTILYDIDFINLMTYDYCAPWGMGHKLAANTSPFIADTRDPDAKSIPKSVENWLKAGFPVEKLILGLSYYGYTFNGFEMFEEVVKDAEGNLPDGKSMDTGLGWNKVIDRVNDEGWIKSFDKATMSTWYTSPDENSFIYCDDPVVVDAKVAWAKQNGLGGVFSWCLNLDILSDKSVPLQDAAWDAWPAQ